MNYGVKMMKIAVTGATGHLGGQIINKLTKFHNKKDVVALVHNKKHAQDLIDQGIEVRTIDFQKKDTLENSFKGITTLIYVASKT